MLKKGFYIIKDSFFSFVGDKYLKFNKEQRRPHYYCLFDKNTGLYWVIPLSSRIEKYKKLMQKRIDEGKPCNTIHILKLDNGRENAFLLHDMFPITEDFIEKEYLIEGNPMRITSERDAAVIERKAKRVLGMIKRGVKFMSTQPDVLKIQEKLMTHLK